MRSSTGVPVWREASPRCHSVATTQRINHATKFDQDLSPVVLRYATMLVDHRSISSAGIAWSRSRVPSSSIPQGVNSRHVGGKDAARRRVALIPRESGTSETDVRLFSRSAQCRVFVIPRRWLPDNVPDCRPRLESEGLRPEGPRFVKSPAIQARQKDSDIGNSIRVRRARFLNSAMASSTFPSNR